MLYRDYRQIQYFPGLDGVRALSVLAVITVHVSDNLATGAWSWVGGASGVAVFFVLSGYLITTLALREEAERGSLSLKAFYIRRTMRIFPAYYYVVGVTTLLCATGGDIAWSSFREALPYYLLYSGEYAPVSYFYQSWSLGVEEKFYLIWPPVCFVLLRGRKKARFVVAALLMLSPLFVPSPWTWYPRIMAGCLLALALHEERLFRAIQQYSVGWLAPVVLLGGHTLAYAGATRHGWPQAVYTLAIVYFLAVCLVTRPRWVEGLEWAPLRWVGRRAYGIYLLHVLVVSLGVGVLLPIGTRVWWIETVNLLFTSLLAIGAAEVLYRVVEDPFRKWGSKRSDQVLNGGLGSSEAIARAGLTTR